MLEYGIAGTSYMFIETCSYSPLIIGTAKLVYAIFTESCQSQIFNLVLLCIHNKTEVPIIVGIEEHKVNAMLLYVYLPCMSCIRSTLSS